MRIVRARPQDAFVVAALSLQIAIAVGGSREEGYLDRAAEHWLRHHEQLPTWFAEHEGAHAGFLQAVLPTESTWPGQRPGTRGQLWVDSLYVREEHRREGIGLALVRACEEWAKGAGIATIRLSDAGEAQDFCDAAGYVPAAQVREKRLRPLR